MSQNSRGKLLGGILLVSGTTIGAGMLALPVVTGLAGFFPSLLLFLCYWIFMTYTAFLLLEVNMWMKNSHANIISMAKVTLGKWGAAFSWVVYLFLLYSLTTAYLAGCGPIVVDVFASFGITVPWWFGPLPLLAIFGYFVFRGTRSVDYVNRILMFGLAVTFVLLTTLLFSYNDTKLLQHINWKLVPLGVSVVATSFGFHIVIPTLTTYFHRNIPHLSKTLLIGSFIPLVVYILWNFLTLGIIPFDQLLQGYYQGANGAHLLTQIIVNPWLALLARCFAFFAIITSFLGVSLSLMDFLADGLHIPKSFQGRSIVSLLTFLPPLVITYTYPRAFLNALEYAGAFGVVLLLAVLPAAMVWKGRYEHRLDTEFTTPGGKPALLAVFFASAIVIALEIAHRAGWLALLLQ